MSNRGEVMRKRGLVDAISQAPKPELAEIDEERECGCFGYLRGLGDRALNLEFIRSAEGDVVSFPYSWLGPSRYDPSVGILLVFSAGELYGVRIKGRNSNALLDDGMSLYDRGIMRQRVTLVREVPERENRQNRD